MTFSNPGNHYLSFGGPGKGGLNLHPVQEPAVACTLPGPPAGVGFLMTQVSGAMALLRGLIAQGIDTVFGLPGGQLDHFFDALYHEQRTRALRRLAPRAGRRLHGLRLCALHRRPSVYAVVPGPGVLNTTAALCTAYACNAPVLCLTGQIPSGSIGRGFGELHELPDQLATLRTLTKWAARIETGARTRRPWWREAFRELTEGRPRPVSLEMAMDMMGDEADVTETAPAAPRAPAPDPDAVVEAARLIAAARAPHDLRRRRRRACRRPRCARSPSCCRRRWSPSAPDAAS